MTTIDIPILQLLAIYALLAIPVGIGLLLQLGNVREMLISVGRMSVQLTLIGLYLGYLFEINNPWLNFAWILVMLVVAIGNVLSSSGLRIKRLFVPAFLGLSSSTIATVGIFITVGIRPEPLYDARYMIPIAGMLLGNSTRGNIVGLERFYSRLRDNQRRLLSDLVMGASLWEATRDEFREAMRAALAPTISSMATIGIVFLPGMMTGQILGGASPIVAIKYQLAIMIAIFANVALGVYLNARLSMKIAFTGRDALNPAIFRSTWKTR